MKGLPGNRTPWMKGLLIIFLFVSSLSSQSQAAEVYFCNQLAGESVYLAIAYPQKGKWFSQGWFLARSGRCYHFKKDIDGGQIYYFAFSQSKAQSWEGDHPFCIASKPFKLPQVVQAEACEKTGGKQKPFNQVKLEGFDVTKVRLKPTQGKVVKAIPYDEASPRQLAKWAKDGDQAAIIHLKNQKKSKTPGP